MSSEPIGMKAVTPAALERAQSLILDPPRNHAGTFVRGLAGGLGAGPGGPWGQLWQTAQRQLRLTFLQRAKNQGAAALEIATARPRTIEIAVSISSDHYIDVMLDVATVTVMNNVDQDLDVLLHEAQNESLRVRPEVPDYPHPGAHIFTPGDEIIFHSVSGAEFDICIHPDYSYLDNDKAVGAELSPFPNRLLKSRNGASVSTGPKGKKGTFGNQQRYYKYTIVAPEVKLEEPDSGPPFRHDPHILDHDF